MNPVSPALRLLAERFDRATGNCLAELPAGWNRPEVGVIRDLPPPGALRTPRRNRRVSPGAVARIIVATPLRKEPIPPLRSPRPRRLDLDDAANLAPRAARLAGLIRSALADPAALKLSGLAGAVRRAAARQVPQATRELEDEAQRRLARHLHGPIADQLAGATKLERGAEWMLVWPPGTGDATVVHGRAEFVLRDADGVWTVVTFSPPGMPEPLERLRWLLSARAAAARGLAPIGPGWRIDLSDDGGSRGEESGSDAQLDLALDRTLEAINATWA